MPSNIPGTLGAKFSLSASLPATPNAAGYTAITTWAKLGNISQIGERADEWETDEFPDLETGVKQSTKTFKVTPKVDITIGHDPIDPGLVVARSAHAANTNYSGKIEYGDGTTDYFILKVVKLTDSPLDGKFRKVNMSIHVQADASGKYYTTV